MFGSLFAAKGTQRIRCWTCWAYHRGALKVFDANLRCAALQPNHYRNVGGAGWCGEKWTRKRQTCCYPAKKEISPTESSSSIWNITLKLSALLLKKRGATGRATISVLWTSCFTWCEERLESAGVPATRLRYSLLRGLLMDCPWTIYQNAARGGGRNTVKRAVNLALKVNRVTKPVIRIKFMLTFRNKPFGSNAGALAQICWNAIGGMPRRFKGTRSRSFAYRFITHLSFFLIITAPMMPVVCAAATFTLSEMDPSRMPDCV